MKKDDAFNTGIENDKELENKDFNIDEPVEEKTPPASSVNKSNSSKNNILDKIKDKSQYVIFGLVGLIGGGFILFNENSSSNSNQVAVNTSFKPVQNQQNNLIDNQTAFKKNFENRDLNENLNDEENLQDYAPKVDNMAALRQSQQQNNQNGSIINSPMIQDFNNQGEQVYNQNQQLQNQQNQQQFNQNQQLQQVQNQNLQNQQQFNQNQNLQNQQLQEQIQNQQIQNQQQFNNQNLNQQQIQNQQQFNNQNLNQQQVQISQQNLQNNQNQQQFNNQKSIKNIDPKNLKGTVNEELKEKNKIIIEREQDFKSRRKQNINYSSSNNNNKTRFKIKSIYQGQAWLDIGNNQLLVVHKGDYLTNKIKVINITENCVFTNYGKLCM